MTLLPEGALVAASLDILPSESLIKRTRSTCPACHAHVSAEVWSTPRGVVMRKHCDAHGPFEVTLAPDRTFYFDSRGDAGNASCCSGGACCGAPSSSKDPFEVLSTCVALIEIVESCNLECPTCFASSPRATGDQIAFAPFDNVVKRVQGVIDRKGFIDILQFSGGEPTIHPEFFRILDWALGHAGIGYVLINTNAVRIAGDARFTAALGERRRRYGKFELYVQFDGVQEAGQRELRAQDLRELRTRAIDAAGAEGVPSTLAMTVTSENIGFLGETIAYGLARSHCRGVVFQPMFRSGRVHDAPLRHAPISVAAVVQAAASQSRGLLQTGDFTPLPCGDPNCHTIGYILRLPDGPVALGRLVDLASMQSFLNDRVDYRLEDLARCGCESEPLAAALKKLELGPNGPFRLFIKPFMDAWTYDEDRIDRCCTHVIRRDGSLDSFCRYYLRGGAAGDTLLPLTIGAS